MSRKKILLLSFVLSCMATLLMSYPSHASGTATITSIDCTSVSLKVTSDKPYLDIKVFNHDAGGAFVIGSVEGLTSPDGTFDVTIPFKAPVPDGSDLAVLILEHSPTEFAYFPFLSRIVRCSDSSPTLTPTIPYLPPPTVHLTCSTARISGKTWVASRYVRVTVELGSTVLAKGTVRIRPVVGASFRVNLRFPRQQPGTMLTITVGGWTGKQYIDPTTLIDTSCSK